MEKAFKVQEIIAKGDWAAIKTGVIWTKLAIESYLGYEGACRKPLPRLTEMDIERNSIGFSELLAYERTLEV